MNLKMKQVSFCLFLILLQSTAYSQATETIKKYKHEIGIDASDLINSLSLTGDGNAANNDYFLNYKYYMKKSNFRFRLGTSLNNSMHRNALVNSERKIRRRSLRLRTAFGIERQKSFMNKWTCNYGVEGLVHYSNVRNIQTTAQGMMSETKTESYTIGANVVIGIKYWICPWLSIGSEAFYTFRMSNWTDISKVDSIINSRNKSEQYFTRFVPNGGIIISARF